MNSTANVLQKTFRNYQKRLNPSEVVHYLEAAVQMYSYRKGVMKICSKFTGGFSMRF